jgi:uncharacterized protein YegP (UPF0339 family)
MAQLRFYKTKRGEFRWHLKAGNHKIIAESGESYKRLRDAVAVARRIFPWHRHEPVFDI